MDKNVKCYRIKNLGNLNVYEQYQILECFLEADDSFLFHEFNTKLSEIKPKVLKRLMNETFDEYCDGLLYFYPLTKGLLDTNIRKIISLCKNKYNSEDSDEDLISKLLIQDEEVMKWEESDQIKLMIFEAFHLNNNPVEKKWIEDRQVFENKYYINESGMNRSASSCIWYCPRNKEEVIQALMNSPFYSIIILNERARFSKYLYAIHYVETAEDYDLIIFDKCEGFCKNVKPRLLKLHQEIIDFE